MITWVFNGKEGGGTQGRKMPYEKDSPGLAGWKADEEPRRPGHFEKPEMARRDFSPRTSRTAYSPNDP